MPTWTVLTTLPDRGPAERLGEALERLEPEPTGVGVLYGKRDLLEEMPPFLGGGSMISRVTTEGFEVGELPAKFEAATPPIVQAVGLAVAIDYLNAVGLGEIRRHEQLEEVRWIVVVWQFP